MLSLPLSGGDIDRGARAARSLALVPLVLVSACPLADAPTGTLGEERLVYFQPSSSSALDERLMVGSRFEVTLSARREDDRERVAQARLRAADASRLRVTPASAEDVVPEDGALVAGPARVEVLQGGASALVVEDAQGGEIDRVLVRAAPAAEVTLIDPEALAASLDARLPAAFSLLRASAPAFAWAAQDRCGEALLPLDALRVASSDPDVLAVEAVGGMLVPLEAHSAGHATLQIEGEPDIAFSVEVEVVEPRDIDEVRIEIADAAQNRALLWGRAFADGREVVGVPFRWEASPRVTLSDDESLAVLATIAVAPEGAPVDERPAEVSAALEEQVGALDLFEVRAEDIRVGRLDAPITPLRGGSCLGPRCDPLQAGVLLCWGMGLRARRRRASRAIHTSGSPCR